MRGEAYEFDKNNVRAMISSLEYSWDLRWCSEESEDKTAIVVDIDGRKIKIPLCADNCNAIIYMLKDIIVAIETDEATTGNTFAISTEMDNKFNKLFETSDEVLLQKINKLVAQLDEEEESAMNGENIGYGDIHDISMGDLHDTLREVQVILAER